MALLARLKKLRTTNGLTQDQFAARLGVKPSMVRDIEAGRQRINSDYIESVAREFSVDPNWLFAVEDACTGFQEPSAGAVVAPQTAPPSLFIQVPMLPQAGGTGLAPVALHPEWLAWRGLDQAALACIRVPPGQALDLIRPGDLLLLDTRANPPLDGDGFAWFNSLGTGAELGRLLLSDNRIIRAHGSPAAMDILVPTDRFQLLGRIVAHWRDD